MLEGAGFLILTPYRGQKVEEFSMLMERKTVSAAFKLTWWI
jgi:hypothetical protein